MNKIELDLLGLVIKEHKSGIDLARFLNSMVKDTQMFYQDPEQKDQLPEQLADLQSNMSQFVESEIMMLESLLKLEHLGKLQGIVDDE